MYTKIRAAIFALLCVTAASPASANLLTNGSFEDTTNFSNNGQDTMVLSPGSTAMPGWTVISNDLAWIGPTNPFGLSASQGSYFLDLTSYSDSGPYGGVKQSISTVASAGYKLTFDLGGATQWGADDSLTACAGATCSLFSISATGTDDWASESLDFTGTGSPMEISLTGSSGTYYIGLDNVSVDLTSKAAPVPEPITVSLFGAGIVGIASMRRRRKAAQA